MGQFDRLIDALATDVGDRLALRAIAARMDANPMTSSRTEAVLRELARPAPETWPDGREFTPQDCLDYATSFMEASGIPADLAFSSIEAVTDVSLDDVSTEQIEDQGLVDHVNEALRTDPGGLAKNPHAESEYRAAQARLNAPPRPDKGQTEWERERDAARRAVIERDYMRAEPGSQAWKEYWKGPLQQELAEILERQTAPPPMPRPESEPEVDTSFQPVGLRELPGSFSWSTGDDDAAP
jgi:hypothetical protein